MAYVTPSEIRDELLGYDITDAPDSLVNKYITEAQQVLITDISASALEEELKGSIDGSNKEFRVKNYPIADTNGDSVINASDIESVKGWKDDTNYDTLTVSKIVAEKGIIILSTAPDPKVYKKITCNYRYYPGFLPDFTLVKLACKIYSTFLFALKEYALMPLRFQVGGRYGILFASGFTQPVYPYDKLLDRYNQIIQKIRKRPVQLQEFPDTKLKENGE